jgi:hypothetical protein
MDKTTWVDAFVRHMIELGITSVKLGHLAETLWPRLGSVDPARVAQADYVLWDASKDGFPDTRVDAGRRCSCNQK